MEKTATKRILLIEDDPDARQVVRETLRMKGFFVQETDDGQIGWQMIQDEHPDLIILDMMLPGMSGREIVKHLRSDPTCKDIPVIGFSAIDRTERQSDDFWRDGLHVDEFIRKDLFDPTDLLGRIEHLLRREKYASYSQALAEEYSVSSNAVGSPMEVVRLFIEAWNTHDFGTEYACLSREMTGGLNVRQYISRRQQILESPENKDFTHVILGIAEQHDTNNDTATVEVEREDERGGRRCRRRHESYLLLKNASGWKIARVRHPHH
jgi:CheY-like chemotaxis protein